MKKPLLITLSLFLFFSCNKTDREILNETISQLTSATNIEYDIISENVNKSYNQNRKDSATCYFDFSSKDTLIVLNIILFQIMENKYLMENKNFRALMKMNLFYTMRILIKDK